MKYLPLLLLMSCQTEQELKCNKLEESVKTYLQYAIDNPEDNDCWADAMGRYRIYMEECRY